MEKAKTKDEKALDALADLRSIELGRRSEKDALSRKYEEKHRALRYSIDDIQMIYDSKELKDWDKAIKAEDKIQSDLGDAHYKAVEKLKNNLTPKSPKSHLKVAFFLTCNPIIKLIYWFDINKYEAEKYINYRK